MRDDLDIPMPASGPSFRVSRRRPGMDPNTKRLLVAAGAIGGTLVLLVGAWSLTGHRANGLPVVEAAAGPLRVKLADPGGMTVIGKDASILSGKPDGTAVLAPPPETPKLQALREQAAAAAAKAAAAKRKVVPVPAVAQAPTPPAAPTKAAAARPALPPVPPIPPGAPPRSAAAPPAAAAQSGTQVQLAALQSEAAAMSEWHHLEQQMPDLMNGKSPTVMKVEHDGRVFYRLRTGGFTDNSEAGKFCNEVKAKGGGCTIAAF